jgi:hypothetical protein
VYAPALVAFFGAPSVRVAIGVPGVSWVALSWGEPLVPWWGRPHFVGRPTWVGWGGPRVVNNVVVNRTTVVNVTNINVYRNSSVQHAVVAVREEQFGRGSVHRVAQIDARRLEPARTPLRVAPDASSFVAASGRGTRPPESTVTRSVVATRAPRRPGPRPDDAARAEGGRGDAQRGVGSRSADGVGAPPPRIVPAPRPASTVPVPARPAFGNSQVERQRPPRPREFGAPQSPERTAPAPREGSAQRPDGNAPPGDARRPDQDAQRPVTPTPRPDGGAQRPEAAPQRPNGSARRPDTSAQRPDANTQRPDAGTRRPDTNGQRPDASTRRPDTGPPRPDSGAQRPGPAPSAGSRPTPPQAPQPSQRVEAGRGPQQQEPRLPGEPANRIAPERAQRRQQPDAPQERRGGRREHQQQQPQPPGR